MIADWGSTRVKLQAVLNGTTLRCILPFTFKMLSLRQEFTATVFSILFWIVFGPIILPLFLLCYAISRLVHLQAKLFHPELIPISKSDSFFAVAPSNTEFSYVYTCQIWRVKGLLDVEAFRNHFYQCFLSTEEDRQRYQNLYCHFVEYMGYIFKKRLKRIDLQWHIHEHQLNEGDSIEKFVGSWMVTHDSGASSRSSSEEIERPTWMIKIIIDTQLNESTVLFKLHHGICDGYTIVHLVDKLSGQHSPYLFKEPVPSLPKIIKAVLQCPYHTFKVWREVYLLCKEKKMLITDEGGESDGDKEWLISLSSLDLETVKGIRRVTRTNFVSVLMSVQIGALKRMLKEVNPKSHLLRDIPSEMFIGHSMGWPNHPVVAPTSGVGMANHLTVNGIKASFHTDDPLERLLDLDRNFWETKSKGYPIISYYVLFNEIRHLPKWVIRSLIKANLTLFCWENGLSSLLGSSNQHFLLGHQVENIWLPVITPSLFPKKKLMTVPFSHSGKLGISVNAETSLVKNQETLDRFTKVHFVQELESLRIRCQQLVE